jgi:hypothetical protein
VLLTFLVHISAARDVNWHKQLLLALLVPLLCKDLLCLTIPSLLLLLLLLVTPCRA